MFANRQRVSEAIGHGWWRRGCDFLTFLGGVQSESTLAYGCLAVWVAAASLLTASPAVGLAWH